MAIWPAYFCFLPGMLYTKGGEDMAKKGMRARVREWMIEYAYLVTLGAIAAIVASSAIYAHQLQRAEDVPATAQAPEIKATAAPTQTPEVTPLPTIAPLVVRTESLRMAGTTVWPADGDILRGYDALGAVYWETLGCYRPHAALDIAGEAGEDVCAIADGAVEDVGRDELWGMRVTVAQTDGREMTYAGLETAAVRAGQNVTRGQRLGTMMARIPCEAELPAHVHIEMRMDGKQQDPEALLPER